MQLIGKHGEIPSTTLARMGERMPDKGERLRLLRESLRWSQGRVANGSDGAFDRTRVVKMENGTLKLNSSRARTGLAQSFGVDRTILDEYLDGRLDLAGFISRMRVERKAGGGKTRPGAVKRPMQTSLASEDVLSESVRYPRLELAVVFFAESGRRWPDDVVAAARAGHFGPEDYSPMEWQAKLDYLETVMTRARRDHSAHYRAAKRSE